MPLRDVRFGSQDICLHQLHHTLAYARVLQHWVEEAQPPVPSQPHCLVGSMLELWQAMDPLITFAEGDVFVTMVPSSWTEIISPWPMKATQAKHPRSHSHSSRACLRGSLSVTHSEGQPITPTMWATAKAEVKTAPPWKFLPLQSTSDHKPPCPLPRFAEITQALWEEEPWKVASHWLSQASCARKS